MAKDKLSVNAKTVGQKIKMYRTQIKMTQEELGKAAGYADSTYKQSISNIERGRSFPSPTRMKKIANALNIDPGLLMFNAEPEENEFKEYLEYLPYLAKADNNTIKNIRFMLGMKVK